MFNVMACFTQAGILIPWDASGANNLIPMELALKIASKIRVGEQFTVYVVIPMCPEGVPITASMQEILYF
jgi:phospholipase D1/2